MKTRTAWACMAGFGMMWCLMAGAGAHAQPGGPAEKKDDKKPGAGNATGVAVVEVFTSEGCDSCPPADDLAAKIAREAKEQGRSVFVLAMHVDYWDYLGWKDAFAKHEFTVRQREYAGVLGKAGGNGGVFTPEMVVNGKAGFNGADSKLAKETIDKAIAGGARFTIEARVGERKPGEPVRVRAKVAGDSRWITLVAAIVEDGLSTDVKSGENKGKTLRHDRVVRAFAHASVKDGAAEVELRLPAGVKEGNCRVVVFGQDEKSMVVYGAVEMGLEEKRGESPAK